MIFDNLFQDMLLRQLRGVQGIILDERLMCFYFPLEKRSEMWFRWRASCLSEGLTPLEFGDPWDVEGCEIFCSRNNILLTNNNDGVLKFVLRGD